jgi:hypothetical protein
MKHAARITPIAKAAKLGRARTRIAATPEPVMRSRYTAENGVVVFLGLCFVLFVAIATTSL